jgi:hypothetical protein
MAVHPRAVLTDGGHLTEMRVQSGSLAGLAESAKMQSRGAGAYQDPVEVKLADVLFYHVLSRVRTHEGVITRNDY